MAARTSINLPHVSGWTNHASGGFQDNGSGYSEPTSYAADRGAVYDTVVTEDSTNWTTGTWFGVEYGPGFEDGAEWRQIYDFQDWNNYRYVKIKWGGVALFTDVYHDCVQLWKVVAGVHSQVASDDALGILQEEAGHLRNYKLENRSTTFYPKVAILTAKDQHIVFVSVKDTITATTGPHERDREYMPVLKATDTRTTTSGKTGLYSVAGSQTIVARACKAELVTLKWQKTAANGGSDSNSGSFTSPYLTSAKLVKNTLANGFGFSCAGTHTGIVSNISGGSTPSGTSHEDKPWIFGYSTDAVVWRGNSTAVYYVKGNVQYRGFYGMEWDGNDTSKDVLYLWAQAAGGSGLTSKYHDFHRIHFRRARNGNNILIVHGTFSGTATGSEYNQYHHWMDCTSSETTDANFGANGAHGFYCESSYNVMEFCTLRDNQGDGGKFSLGTLYNGQQTTHYNIFRFNHVYNNLLWGLLTYNGTNNFIDFNLVYNCATYRDADGGIGIISGGPTFMRSNRVQGCGYSLGTGTVSGGIVITSQFGSAIAGPTYIDGNVTHACPGLGFTVNRNASQSMGDIHYTNNVEYDNGTDRSIGAGITLTTNANNHQTVDGNPLFNDPANRDYTLQSVASPLVDAGSAQLWTILMDAWFQSRPQDNGSNAIDIGPAEYPEPNANAPVVTGPSSVSMVAGVAKAVSTILATDPDGDALTVDVTFDTVTATITSPDYNTGTLVTRG